MECNKTQKLISEYLDGELQESGKKALEAHVRACPACAQRLIEMKRLQTVLQSAPKYPAPSHFAARVMESLERDERRASWFDFFAGEPAYLKVAEVAVAVAMVIVGAVSGSVLTSGKSVQAPTEIRSSFSLDVFDPAPPDSIGGAYLSVLGGDHE